MVAQKPGTWAKHVHGVWGVTRLMRMLNAHVILAQAGGTATPPVAGGRYDLSKQQYTWAHGVGVVCPRTLSAGTCCSGR